MRKGSKAISEPKKAKSDLKKFFYDSDEGTILGRTGSSWGKILLFYWVFYACLIGFLALNYYLFTRTLLESEPTWTLDKSLLGTNPGLTFRPSPDPNDEKYAIVFKSKNDSGAKIWYNQLSEVIKGSTTAPGSPGVVVCNNNGTHATKDTSCKVDVTNLGRCTAAQKFGYLEGKPCVSIKLNRMYGWEPQPFGINPSGQYDQILLNTQLDEKSIENPPMPDSLKKLILDQVKAHPGHEKDVLNTVWISCQGESDVDKKHIPADKISYFPSQGIPGYYFPFLNQKSYLSPFVMVALDIPETSRNADINIICLAWANNIKYQKISGAGGLGFVNIALKVE